MTEAFLFSLGRKMGFLSSTVSKNNKTEMIEQCVFIFEGNFQGPRETCFRKPAILSVRLKSGQDKARSDDAELIMNYPVQNYILRF